MNTPKLPQFSSQPLRDRYLEHADPEVVYAYLEGNPGNVEATPLSYEYPFSIELQKLLLNRNEPLIDLALGQFSADKEIVRELFLRNDQALAIAACSNQNVKRSLRISDEPDWIGSGKLQELLNTASKEILEAYLTNNLLEPYILTALFEEQGVFSGIPDDRYLLAVNFALQNPFLQKPIEEDSFDNNFMDWIENGKIFRAAWNLLLTLPNDPEHACALRQGFSKFNHFALPFDLSMIPGTIKYSMDLSCSWDNLEGDEEKEKALEEVGDRFSESYYLNRQKFLEFVFKRWSANESTHKKAKFKDGEENFCFIDLRQTVAVQATKDPLGGDDGLKKYLGNHPNSEVREGFYAHCKFGHGDSLGEYKSYLEKDKKLFIQNFVYNPVAYSKVYQRVKEHFYDVVENQAEEEYGLSWEESQTLRYAYDTWAKHFLKKTLENFQYMILFMMKTTRRIQ